MMTETQRRIRAYKRALPALRERVIAVALLLAMSASMLTSASFAWITLSRAPEVSGMQTTVAANGNLEIALADGDGEKPEESAVGDSSAAQGQTMVGANITWGNLVNLSDPAYGLNKIALRPALLNELDTKRYPLYGATYGKDGRVISTSEKYMYSSWREETAGNGYFDPANVSYGVRAISSVKWTNRELNNTVEEMLEGIRDAYSKAQAKYYDLVEGRTTVDDNSSVICMSALEGLLERYAQERAENVADFSGTTIFLDYSAHVTNFYKTMERYGEIMEAEGNVLVQLANMQAYLNDSSRGTATFATIDEILAANLSSYGITLSSLESYKTDRNTLNNCLNGTMKTLSEQCDPTLTTSPPEVKWSQISGTVNKFVDINTATLDGMLISGLSINDAGSLLGIIRGNTQTEASTVKIYSGILKNTEQRMGVSMEGKSVMVSIYLNVTLLGIPIQKDVYAKVQTDAADPYNLQQDILSTQELQEQAGQSGTGGTPEAKDTYGMAIDVWLRTNAANAVLTLEGEVRTIQVNETVINKNGGESNLYTMVTTEDGTHRVYELTEGSGDWYYADLHQEVEPELLEGATFTAVMREEVIGYEGENRVWETWRTMLDQQLIEKDNTTQGAGSCFVFYANPTEQTNILELLRSFCISFLDEESKEIGRAILNVDRYYAINGKVTVPLEMLKGTEYVETVAGEDIVKTGITPLQQNVPKRITAVVYLDGMQLQNQNVLASGEIEGQLNLQFGSSVSLKSVEDKELQKLYRTITASASTQEETETEIKTSTSADNPIAFKYDGTAKRVTVTLNVSGEQPKNISGFFVRKINNTQGTRADTAVFSDADGDGNWTGEFNLITPGDYLLRSLIVDGVEYTLGSFPAVNVAGLNVARVSTSLSTGVHMTADSTLDTKVTAVIDTDPSLMPSQVRAVFRATDDSEVNAIMEFDSESNEWSGTATFRKSDTYVLEYLVMDGNYSDIPENYRTSLIISLGMTSQVWLDYAKTDLTSPEFEYKGGNVTLPMQVKIMNNGGLEMRNMEGTVELFYHVDGSSLDENGLSAVMTWDGEYYSGNFILNSAGRYKFDRVTISKGEGAEKSTSTIRSTVKYPEIVAMPPDPPAWVGNRTAADYQVEIETGAAKLSVALAYADAAIIGGKIVDQDGNAEIVLGTKTSTTETVTINDEPVKAYVYDFVIPNNSSANQNGDWTLEELYFQNVFVDLTPGDGDDTTTLVPSTGNIPTAEDSYIMSVPSGEDVSAYVVATLETTLIRDGKAYTGDAFGGTKEAPTGAFMETHTIQPVTLTVEDWNHKPITGVANVIWDLEYTTVAANQSEAYGGYTPVNHTPNVADQEITSTDGKTFTTKAFTLQIAGEYTSKLTVGFKNGDTVVQKATKHAPEITIASIAPAVRISAISPTGTFDVDKTSIANDSHGNNDAAASYTSTEATVYFQCARSGEGSTCAPYRHNYTRPSVTITLSGYGFAQGAELKFGDDVYIYNGTTQTTGYSWTGNGTCVRNIGYYRSVFGNNDSKTPAGDLSATSLTLTVGNYSYTVPVTIKIHNPY